MASIHVFFLINFVLEIHMLCMKETFLFFLSFYFHFILHFDILQLVTGLRYNYQILVLLFIFRNLDLGTIIASGTIINFGVFLDSGTIILAVHVLLFDTAEYTLFHLIIFSFHVAFLVSRFKRRGNMEGKDNLTFPFACIGTAKAVVVI